MGERCPTASPPAARCEGGALMKLRQPVQNRRSSSPNLPRVVWLIALAGLAGVALLQPAQRPAQAGVMVGPPLVEPIALRSRNGVLDVTLVEKPGVAQVAGMPVQDVWTYQVGENGTPNYPGPTLYVQPGDTLRLKIVNRLPPSQSPRG